MLSLPQYLWEARNNQFTYQLLWKHGSGVLQINGRERSALTAQGCADTL